MKTPALFQAAGLSLQVCFTDAARVAEWAVFWADFPCASASFLKYIACCKIPAKPNNRGSHCEGNKYSKSQAVVGCSRTFSVRVAMRQSQTAGELSPAFHNPQIRLSPLEKTTAV
jgi:hypothetical protein